MKAFIERTLPVLEPFLIRRNDGRPFTLRATIPPASVILSVAGIPELKVFDQLSRYVNFLYGKSLRAEIYRPAAETLTQPEFAETTKEILEATVQAGRELVQPGSISAATMERITQPIAGDFESIARWQIFFGRPASGKA